MDSIYKVEAAEIVYDLKITLKKEVLRLLKEKNL